MRRSWKEQGQLRSPGFRGGGGGRFVNNWVWSLWPDTTGSGLYGPGKRESIEGGYPPPHGGGSYQTTAEARAYIGKGVPGGVAEAFEWDFKELILVAAPQLSASGEVEYPLPATPPATTYIMFIHIPLVIFIYPILDPWIIPSAGFPLTSEPRTTFHDNLAVMPSGFLDPATGVVGTNAMAQQSAGQIRQATPYLDTTMMLTDPPGATLLSWKINFDMHYAPHAGIIGTWPFNRPAGWANPSGIPSGPFSRATHFEISNPPSGTIYGVGLFAFTLLDYYRWTSDTSNIYLLSRGTRPENINALPKIAWTVQLVPYQLPQSLSWETHIWESDDTGLTDAQLMALRTAGVYEQNEKALLVVM